MAVMIKANHYNLHCPLNLWCALKSQLQFMGILLLSRGLSSLLLLLPFIYIKFHEIFPLSMEVMGLMR